MPWNEDLKGKSPKDLNEEPKEDNFSFLQETIKPEPITGKQVRRQLLKLAVYGIVGWYVCLPGFLCPKAMGTEVVSRISKDCDDSGRHGRYAEGIGRSAVTGRAG